jgi:hypothetical protein
LKNFKFIKQDGKAYLTWDAPEAVGKNGGHVTVENLKYRILRSDYKIVEVEGTSYLDEVEMDGAQQKYIFYYLEPFSDAGSGPTSFSNFISFGTPYTMPFNESFANAKVEKSPWIKEYASDIDQAKTAWVYTNRISVWPMSVDAQDNDGGLAYFNSFDCKAGASMRLISPTVDIKDFANPKLTFWFYHYNGSGSNNNDKIQIEISADDSAYEDLEGALLQLNEKATGWTLYEFPLTKYVGSEYISVSFKGISGYGLNMAIDNITIENEYGNDIQVVSFSGPSVINVGTSNTYKTIIRNNGKNTVNESDYAIKLYIDDEEFSSKNGASINYNELDTIKFEVPAVTLQEVGKNYAYHIEAIFAQDENTADNTSKKMNVIVSKPTFPAVEDLSGSVDESTVTLNWTEPVYPQSNEEGIQKVSDDFESYSAFIIDNIGDWTVVDNDGGETYAPNGTQEDAYPNVYAPMAFQVYNPSQVDEDVAKSPLYAPHSGSQYLVAWGTPYQSAGEPNGAAPNDDWLISPALSEFGEQLSFYAKAITDQYGTEKFEVLYSATSKNIEDFILLDNGSQEVTGTWTEFNFSIPFGAKYFAIRYISEDVYGLMLDDISYQSETITLKGYNVYRNGEMINDTLVTETSYINQDLADGIYNYQVSVVYEEGESYFSNKVDFEIETSGLEDIESAIKIYSINNAIVIERAEGINIFVLSLEGKLLFNEILNNSKQIIPMEKGAYIVKYGNKAQKVIVK